MPKGLLAIICSGALCGALDISAACIDAYIASGLTPGHLLQSVAGGLLGRRTFQGGLMTATMGIAMHFTMALTVATIFYALTRRFSLPQRLSVVIGVGISYGAAVFVVNNFVTAPLLSWVRSLYLHTPILFRPPMGFSQLVIHMFCVGLPIALVIRHYSERPNTAIKGCRQPNRRVARSSHSSETGLRTSPTGYWESTDGLGPFRK